MAAVALLVGGLSLAALSSCTRGTQAVFASVEQEVRTDRNNLVDNTAGTGIVRTLAAASEDRYYAAVGGVFFRPADNDDADWQRVPNPPEFASAVALGLAGVGSGSDPSTIQVYAYFVNQAGTRYGLYRVNAAGNGWDERIFPLDESSGVRITGLVGLDTDFNNVPDTLLMSYFDPAAPDSESRQRLVVNPHASSPVVHQLRGAGGAGSAAPLRTAVTEQLNGTDSFVWLVTARGGLFRVPLGTLQGSEAELSPLPGGDAAYPTASDIQGGTFRGIAYHHAANSADRFVALSTTDGYVFATADASAWVRTEKINRALLGLHYVPGTSKLVVGTVTGPGGSPSKRGLYELAVTLPSDSGGLAVAQPTEPDGQYSRTELLLSAVDGFWIDSDQSPARLFVLTVGSGIWRGDLNTKSEWDWQWE